MELNEWDGIGWEGMGREGRMNGLDASMGETACPDSVSQRNPESVNSIRRLVALPTGV